MEEYMGTDRIMDRLEDILKVLNVIADLLQQTSELDVTGTGARQRELALRETLREEVQKKCQEGFVLQMRDLLKNYDASCVSEIKAEDLTKVLAVAVTYHR